MKYWYYIMTRKLSFSRCTARPPNLQERNKKEIPNQNWKQLWSNYIKGVIMIENVSGHQSVKRKWAIFGKETYSTVLENTLHSSNLKKCIKTNLFQSVGKLREKTIHMLNRAISDELQHTLNNEMHITHLFLCLQ